METQGKAWKIESLFSTQKQARWVHDYLKQNKPNLQFECFRDGFKLYAECKETVFLQEYQKLADKGVFRGHKETNFIKKEPNKGTLNNSTNIFNNNFSHNSRCFNSTQFQQPGQDCKHETQFEDLAKKQILSLIVKQNIKFEEDVPEAILDYLGEDYLRYFVGPFGEQCQNMCELMLRKAKRVQESDQSQVRNKNRSFVQGNRFSQKNHPTNSQLLEKQPMVFDESDGQEERQDLQNQSNASQMLAEFSDSKMPSRKLGMLDQGKQNQEQENSEDSNSQMSIESEKKQQQQTGIIIIATHENQAKPGHKSAQAKNQNPPTIPTPDNESMESQFEMQENPNLKNSPANSQRADSGNGNDRNIIPLVNISTQTPEGETSPPQQQRSSVRNVGKQQQSYKWGLTRQYNQKQPPFDGSDIKQSNEEEEAAGRCGDGAASNHTKKESKNCQPVKVDKGKKPGQKFKYKCGHWDYLGKKIPWEEEVCDECKQWNSKAENLKQKLEYSQGFTNHVAKTPPKTPTNLTGIPILNQIAQPANKKRK